MMKTHILQLTVFASLMLSMATQATTPSTVLKVKGNMGVPSCIVNAPDGGIYNVGKVSSTKIKAGTVVTELAPIRKTWTVICDGVTYLSLTSHDNRIASISDVTGIHNFGLGFVNGTGKIGFYRTTMSNAKVDGASSFLYFIDASNALQGGHSLETLRNNYRFGWAENTTTAKAGKIFSADFTVTPTLAGASTMGGPITENINIDGSLTMNFAFGI